MNSAATPSFSGKKIAILGYGAEGQALHQYLAQHGAQDITICDRSTAITGEQIEAVVPGARASLQTGAGYLANLDQFDVIFRSPGVQPFLPEIKAATHAGARLDSLTKLFFRMCPAKIIGVTGSNGKTTTSGLIAHLLRENTDPGRAYGQVWEGGNDRLPLLADLDKISTQDLVVLELSSFQLYDLEVSPNIAVITNLAINHLDWHADMNDYTQAKANIFRHQKKGAHYFVNGDDAESLAFRNTKSQGRLHLYKSLATKPTASPLPYITHPANLSVHEGTHASGCRSADPSRPTDLPPAQPTSRAGNHHRRRGVL